MLRKIITRQNSFSLTLCVFLLTSSSQAWSIDQLTEENIRAFYKEQAALSSGDNSEEKIRFFKKHTHKDYEFTFNYWPVTDIDNQAPVTFNRQQIIERASKNPEGKTHILDYTLEILLSNNKKSAQVKNRQKFSNPELDTLSVTTECDEEVVISSEGVIQLLESNCRLVVPEELKNPKPQ